MSSDLSTGAEVSALEQEARASQTAPARLLELSAYSELRQLVAAHVRTPAEHLAQLSKDEDWRVRQAVTGNANTPLDSLLKLAREFPETFCLNPLLPLLELAQPGWLKKIDDLTWLYLLKSKQIPRYWISWLEREKRPANRSLVTPASDTYGVWVAAKLHTYQPELHANGVHIGSELVQGLTTITRHQRTPALLLRQLATFPCPPLSLAEMGKARCDLLLQNVAQSSRAPEDVLRLLADDSRATVRYSVGRNRQTPRDILERLSIDPSAHVRGSVGGNEATPPEILERMAYDTTCEERYEQAKQRIAPRDSLHSVSRMGAQNALNDLKQVKGALAGNAATPARILLLLAAHSEVEVRSALAGNPEAPAEALMLLVDDCERVLENLVMNPSLPEAALSQLATHSTTRVGAGVAAHPRTPPLSLARLAESSLVDVRKIVAKNERTPGVVLTSLAQEGEDAQAQEMLMIVRNAVAQNPATPPATLALLAGSSVSSIVEALAQNPRLPGELIDVLLETWSHSRTIQEHLLHNPGLSLAQLERLAQSGHAQIQIAVQRRQERLSQLGERGLRRYPCVSDRVREVATNPASGFSLPLYEIQVQVLEYRRTGPPGSDVSWLRNFLQRFQFASEERQEIFELILPAWSQRWKTHNWHSQEWLELLAEMDLSTDWQRTFAASPLWQERYALAVRPGVEADVLAQLTDDSNRYVREAARWYWQERTPGAIPGEGAVI